MDGYKSSVSDLIFDQIKVKARLIAIHKEMSAMPDPPRDSETWITSLPDLNPNAKNFSMKNLKKIVELRKEAQILLDKEENNNREMKIYDIESIINKIDTTLKNEG